MQHEPHREPPSDPSLDFASEHFNAAKALAHSGLRPPVADAQPLDYVAKCRRILPTEMPESLATQAPAGARDEGAREEAQQRHLSFKERATRMASRIEAGATASLERVHAAVPPAGPLAPLHRWQAAGARVRVVTRHARGVRGVATGTLLAFDRFMNLVLRDVTEQYTVLLKEPRVKEKDVWRPAPVLPGAAAAAAAAAAEATALGQPMASAPETPLVLVTVRSVRWVRRQDKRQRQLGQIFVKGDSVVVVSAADAYLPAPAGGRRAAGGPPGGAG